MVGSIAVSYLCLPIHLPLDCMLPTGKSCVSFVCTSLHSRRYNAWLPNNCSLSWREHRNVQSILNILSQMLQSHTDIRSLAWINCFFKQAECGNQVFNIIYLTKRMKACYMYRTQ